MKYKKSILFPSISKQLIMCIIVLSWKSGRIYIPKSFFDCKNRDFIHTLSDHMTMDDIGNLVTKLFDNMAFDMDPDNIYMAGYCPLGDEDD